ncbi:MAG: HAD-IIB family hydrolase [bacterium]|nr:HAD-IIB family hydrolase [bacterium]
MHKQSTAKTNKERKITIVSVSGGFDPLHIGHVRLFQEAKKLGDKLVVILNNDNWLKKKKGYAFMPQEERKEIIKALAVVDEVMITNHPINPKDMSVCAELAFLKPHIFANGGDRTLKNIPEVETCEKIGCKMVFSVGQGGKIQSSSWLLEQHSKKAIFIKQSKKFSAKKIIIFDLDGTLTASKAILDQEMASLLCRLLEKKKVMVIGGGSLAQFRQQFLKYLSCPKEKLENLFISPTSGASMYKNRNGEWQEIYRYTLSSEEQRKILVAFKKALRDIRYENLKKTYGKIIENRGSQITFSALGQKAPLAAKEKWHKESDIRLILKNTFEKYLPEFEARLGGLTSIDVTKKGIDKAYGVRRIAAILKIPVKEMVYVGDALYEGGNDFTVVRAGIDTLQVSGPAEAECFIRCLLF